MSKKNYIGLADTFHDSALAIVDSQGQVVFAEATERYLQNKRSIGCAPDFFQRVSSLLGEHCEPDAETVVAHSWSARTPELMREVSQGVAEDERKLEGLFGEIPEFMKTHLSSRDYFATALTSCVERTGRTLKYELNQRGGGRYITELDERRYDHHLTHAAAACYSSPFDEGVCAIIDGLGEASSTACYTYKDGEITRITQVPNHSPGSLGLFYTLICVTCGFGHLTGEEWKVMGLAPYGELEPETHELLRSMISVEGLTIQFPSATAMLGLSQKIHRLRRLPGQPPLAAANLARAGQQVFSEVYFQFLRNLRDLGISGNLILGGGCALNSAANGRILRETGFERLHIPSAPGDDGNAVGAAWLAYREDHPGRSGPPGSPPGDASSPALLTPYLGSSMAASAVDNLVKYGPPGQQRLELGELCRRTAQALADGKIVGWVQGRAEYGPRALGNRSILADARDPEMKDKVNARIKYREAFRPFAPSILHEHGPEYFHDYQESPYMERTLVFRDEVHSKVPAVVHENGTGRLQTVKAEWNERYYRLIRAFYELTGVPLLLNTSFNIMGKPIIHSVEDALAVFYTSGLDVLVVGDLYLEKSVGSSSTGTP